MRWQCLVPIYWDEASTVLHMWLAASTTAVPTLPTTATNATTATARTPKPTVASDSAATSL